jgi:hypothetical protein
MVDVLAINLVSLTSELGIECLDGGEDSEGTLAGSRYMV